MVRQGFEFLTLSFKPIGHIIRVLHQLFHFLHGFQMSGILFLKHLHTVLFAQFGHFFEGFGVELSITGAAELVAGHGFHGVSSFEI